MTGPEKAAMDKTSRPGVFSDVAAAIADFQSTAAASGGLAQNATQVAVGALTQVFAQAVGMSLQNAVLAQQREAALAQAVTARVLEEIMASDAEDLPRRIEQAQAAIAALRPDGGEAGTPGVLLAEFRKLLVSLPAATAHEGGTGTAGTHSSTEAPKHKTNQTMKRKRRRAG